MTAQFETVDNVLEHFGVKGQKWGVRRAEKKLAKADAKWEKQSEKRKTMWDIYNKAADGANRDLPGINKKWARVDIRKPGVNLDRYNKEVSDNFNKHMTKAADDYGLSPSGSKKLEASYDILTGFISVSSVDAFEHADSSELHLILEKDENGFITKITIPDFPELTMSQTLLLGEEFLEHYGVRGQKWGVRKASRSPSSDAKQHASSKKKHISELDDKELQKFVGRLNMEQQYKRLNPSPAKKGYAAVKGILAVGATISAVLTFSNTPAGKAITQKLSKKLENHTMLGEVGS